MGLVTGEMAAHVTGTTVVVRPDLAVGQLAADAEEAAASARDTAGSDGDTASSGIAVDGSPTADGAASMPVTDDKLRRFYGVAHLDRERYQRDFSKLAQEIIANLAGHLGTDIEVTVDIRATNADGFPESVVRTVTENARTLKLDEQGFERD